MKKTYITPALVAVKILSTQLMVNSVLSDKDGEEQWSNKYQGPAGGFLWEDDNNVTE